LHIACISLLDLCHDRLGSFGCAVVRKNSIRVKVYLLCGTFGVSIERRTDALSGIGGQPGGTAEATLFPRESARSERVSRGRNIGETQVSGQRRLWMTVSRSQQECHPALGAAWRDAAIEQSCGDFWQGDRGRDPDAVWYKPHHS
jgi:hypothetical protein